MARLLQYQPPNLGSDLHSSLTDHELERTRDFASSENRVSDRGAGEQ